MAKNQKLDGVDVIAKCKIVVPDGKNEKIEYKAGEIVKNISKDEAIRLIKRGVAEAMEVIPEDQDDDDGKKNEL